MITQEFDLNMVPDSEPVVVHVNQYDIGSGRFVASLYDKDQPYSPPAGATAVIQGTKPDKHGFCYDVVSISGNVATANVTQQMTAVAGITPTQIVVTDSAGRTGTFNFMMDVQQSALQDDTDISDTELPAIIDAARQSAVEAKASEDAAALSEQHAKTSEDNAKASEDAAKDSEENAKDSEDNAKDSEDNAAQSALDAAQSVEDAEAWAVGQRNGADVPSTDPTYENNSKYYAQNASASAADAQAQADRAEEYADYVIPSFIIANNRLYIKQKTIDFTTANNRLYVKIA